ncbi:MAG: hypothetical protein KAU03_00260 [Candidatus Altiarchaeales archaeon]|nr:hypothetical protein [Candidatus Altiarchaeales archaeon]
MELAVDDFILLILLFFVIPIGLPIVFFFSSYYVLKRFLRIGRVKNAIASLFIASLLGYLSIVGVTLCFEFGMPDFVFPWGDPTSCLNTGYDKCVETHSEEYVRSGGCGTPAIGPLFCRLFQVGEYVLILVAALVIVVPPAIERIRKVTKKS